MSASAAEEPRVVSAGDEATVGFLDGGRFVVPKCSLGRFPAAVLYHVDHWLIVYRTLYFLWCILFFVLNILG